MAAVALKEYIQDIKVLERRWPLLTLVQRERLHRHELDSKLYALLNELHPAPSIEERDNRLRRQAYENTLAKLAARAKVLSEKYAELEVESQDLFRALLSTR